MKKIRRMKITGLIIKACPVLLIEVLMGLCVNLCITKGNSYISKLVDAMALGNFAISRHIVEIFILLVLVGFAASYIQRFCAGTFANKVCTGYRDAVTEKLYKVEYRYIASNNTGTILNKIIGDIGTVESLLDITFPEILADFIATVVYAVYIAKMNLKLFIVMIVSYPVIFWFVNLFVKKVRKYTLIFRKKSDDMADISQSVVHGIMVIRAFRLEKLFNAKMNKAARDLVKNEEKRQIISNAAIVARQMLQWLPNIICAVYAAFITGHGELSIGELVAFILILSRFIDCFVGMPFAFVDASMSLASIDRIEDILAQEEEVSGTYTGDNEYSGKDVITFENVGFSYGTKNVLDGVYISIEWDDDIGLIGESGGGKSTLMNLLCGFYDDFAGEIKVYGKDIREWDKEALRDKISLVSQDVFLFPVSIEENVAYGKCGATREDVVKACKEANIHEFIESLPDGYKTVIGERGTKLSGGQKQRLSIARAILKDAPIMIMDEPTSSIDVETENEIQKEIEKIGHNKTCITIAHRLNTIRHCNHVYKVENGKIAESGVNP